MLLFGEPFGAQKSEYALEIAVMLSPENVAVYARGSPDTARHRSAEISGRGYDVLARSTVPMRGSSGIAATMLPATSKLDRLLLCFIQLGTPICMEFGETDALFAKAQDSRTADYVAGRFG